MTDYPFNAPRGAIAEPGRHGHEFLAILPLVKMQSGGIEMAAAPAAAAQEGE